MEVPWYALSPSPFTIIFYLILVVYGAKHLITNYRGWKRLYAFTEALFTVGLIVLVGDLLWAIVCFMRFAYIYPDSVTQLTFCIGRDLVGIIFCYLLIGNYFKTGVLNFRTSTRALLIVNFLFLILWFASSPSPAYTDWTYAIRFDYPLRIILASFSMSHIIGKALIGSVYYTIWRKQK